VVGEFVDRELVAVRIDLDPPMDGVEGEEG